VGVDRRGFIRIAAGLAAAGAAGWNARPAASAPKCAANSGCCPDTIISGRQQCRGGSSASNASARVTCSRRAVLSARSM